MGLASSARARSDGMFNVRASQFGTFGRTAYALDLDYEFHDGVRPNNQLKSIEWYQSLRKYVHSKSLVSIEGRATEEGKETGIHRTGTAAL